MKNTAVVRIKYVLFTTQPLEIMKILLNTSGSSVIKLRNARLGACIPMFSCHNELLLLHSRQTTLLIEDLDKRHNLLSFCQLTTVPVWQLSPV